MAEIRTVEEIEPGPEIEQEPNKRNRHQMYLDCVDCGYATKKECFELAYGDILTTIYPH